MRELLCDARLVHEQSTDSQHASDLAERGDLAASSPADVIAGPEVDDDVKAAALERKLADVGDVHRGTRPRATQAQLRGADQRGINVHTDELARIEALAEHWKRDAASASYLEHPSAARK